MERSSTRLKWRWAASHSPLLPYILHSISTLVIKNFWGEKLPEATGLAICLHLMGWLLCSFLFLKSDTKFCVLWKPAISDKINLFMINFTPPPPFVAWNGWSLSWWIFHHVQASETWASWDWSNSFFTVHTPKVSTSVFPWKQWTWTALCLWFCCCQIMVLFKMIGLLKKLWMASLDGVNKQCSACVYWYNVHLH